MDGLVMAVRPEQSDLRLPQLDLSPAASMTAAETGPDEEVTMRTVIYVRFSERSTGDGFWFIYDGLSF